MDGRPVSPERTGIIMKSQKSKLAHGLMVTPSLVVFFALFAIPLLNTLRLSLLKDNVFSFSNYLLFFSDPGNMRILYLSLFLALASTMSVIALSVPLALLLRKNSVWGKLCQALILVPLIMPPIISAFGLLLFWKNNGWFNLFLLNVFKFTDPLKINYTVHGLIIFYTWLYFPYTALNAISAVRGIDPSIENAARVGGARELAVFMRVTLPLMIPGLISGAVLTFIMAFGAFTIPLIAGGNIRPISVHIYTVATVFNKWNESSSIAIVMAIIQVIILSYFVKFSRKKKMLRA
jgi:putative spermidine/putrescine transport system permease protein